MSDYNEILEKKLEEALRAKKKRKVRLYATLASLTIAVIATLSVASYAWFAMFTAGSNLATVTGDLNVNINKITAYKYVYPYYQNSTEFIDYGSTGTVKGYVVEDSSINSPSDPVNSATITFAVNTPVDPEDPVTNDLIRGTYTTTENSNASNKVMYNTVETFRYFLFGDSTFTGVSSNQWSSSTSIGFSSRNAIEDTAPAVLSNVVVPVGATFTFFNTDNIGAGSVCDYYKYTSCTANSCFEIVNEVDNNERITSSAIRCLKSGIYEFSVVGNASGTAITSMTITTINRSDHAIIANNMLDPTMIFLDYSGGHGPHGEKPGGGTYDISDFLPEAINGQETMVVLDVELSFTNVGPVEIGTKVIRERSELAPTNFDHSDTVNNLIGYQDAEHRNALYASDFYCFSATFTDDAHKYATADDIWAGLHVETDAETDSEEDFVRFPTYDPETPSAFEYGIECNMRAKSGFVSESAEAVVIPGSDPDAETKPMYHCYIGIEYDHIYTDYFMYTDRLGKTYLLDRDFGFHITATQYVES